jgi:hypothetical protein
MRIMLMIDRAKKLFVEDKVYFATTTKNAAVDLEMNDENLFTRGELFLGVSNF